MFFFLGPPLKKSHSFAVLTMSKLCCSVLVFLLVWTTNLICIYFFPIKILTSISKLLWLFCGQVLLTLRKHSVNSFSEGYYCCGTDTNFQNKEQQCELWIFFRGRGNTTLRPRALNSSCAITGDTASKGCFWRKI